MKSKRLLAIAAMVPKGSRLADVGSDHALLPIYLAKEGLILSAVASDIGEGPLGRAAANIKNNSLEDIISVRLCDGLSGFEPGSCDCIVIAGLGGILMERILREGIDAVKAASCLVLSPHSDADRVRDFMSGVCDISDEDMVFEDGKFYRIIKYDTSLPPHNLDETERLYGPRLMEKGHPVLKDYLIKQTDVYKGILSKMDAAETKDSADRRVEIQKLLDITMDAVRRTDRK